jgi:hypothetical protein
MQNRFERRLSSIWTNCAPRTEQEIDAESRKKSQKSFANLKRTKVTIETGAFHIEKQCDSHNQNISSLVARVEQTKEIVNKRV